MKGIYKYAAMGCVTAQDITPGVIYDTPCEKEKFNHSNKSTMTISGNITDEFGGALPGATILNVSNQNASTITDVSGNFTAEAKANDVIQISYVGFKTLSFKASQVPSSIKMEPKVEQLDAVVVVAPKNVEKKPSLKNFIKENQAWIMVGLTIVSIGIVVYYQNKNSK